MEQAYPSKLTVLAEAGGEKSSMQVLKTSAFYMGKIHVDKIKLAL